MSESITFGEYVRRLRRAAKRSLFHVAQETHLSYSFLSRVENDSTVPGPDSVVKLAEALGGDLKEMLELSKCLPRAILDRIMAREEEGASTLRRAAYEGQEWGTGASGGGVLEEAKAAGLDEDEARAVSEAVRVLYRLDAKRRLAVVGLILSLQGEGSVPYE